VHVVAVWCFEKHAQPRLRACRAAPVSEFHEPAEVEAHWGGEDGIPVLAADPQLHWLAEEAFNINIVPAFLRVATRRKVIDLHEVIRLVAKHRAKQFGFVADLLLAFDRVTDDFSIFVTEQVGGKPAGDFQLPGAQSRSKDGLEPRLAGLAVAATKRDCCGFSAIVRRKVDERAAMLGCEACVIL